MAGTCFTLPDGATSATFTSSLKNPPKVISSNYTTRQPERDHYPQQKISSRHFANPPLNGTVSLEDNYTQLAEPWNTAQWKINANQSEPPQKCNDSHQSGTSREIEDSHHNTKSSWPLMPSIIPSHHAPTSPTIRLNGPSKDWRAVLLCAVMKDPSVSLLIGSNDLSAYKVTPIHYALTLIVEDFLQKNKPIEFSWLSLSRLECCTKSISTQTGNGQGNWEINAHYQAPQNANQTQTLKTTIRNPTQSRP